MENCDLFIIGGGSASIRASRIATANGAKVVMAEVSKLGGTCVNLGCIPKKIFSYGAELKATAELASGYGWKADISNFNWVKFIQAKDDYIAGLNKTYSSFMDKFGVKVVYDHAKIKGPGVVTAGGVDYQAKHILIGTGAKATRLGIPGDELAITSDSVFSLPALPKKILVVGGGYIAVEMASIFNNFGSEVTLAYRSTGLLSQFDTDLGEMVAEAMQKNGVKIKWNCNLVSLQKNQNSVEVNFGKAESEVFDHVLYAIGRTPNISNIGLENINAKLNNGNLAVNAHFQVLGQDDKPLSPSVYAAGDSVGLLQLTPVAIKEGSIAMHHLFQGAEQVFNYNNVPKAVFCTPNIATVGITEKDAMEAGIKVTCHKAKFTPLKYSFAKLDHPFFIKMVVEDETDKVLGLHLFGEDCAEIIQGFSVAISLGLKKSDLKMLAGIHPTITEEIITLK